ncbi:hypothetical protein MRX96_035889 [Rhipicephalus microplus]
MTRVFEGLLNYSFKKKPAPRHLPHRQPVKRHRESKEGSSGENAAQRIPVDVFDELDAVNDDLVGVPLRALREWLRGWLRDLDTRMVRFLGRLRDRDRDPLPSDRPSVESFDAWSSSAVALNSFIAS